MHLFSTLYFETVAKLLQGGGKVVTKALSEPCIMKRYQDRQTHHKVPKCVFLVCFLANQALHSFNTNRVFENSQLTLFFSEI